jgi:transposase InsO family protein
MIETFNAKVRAECLDQHWFVSLEEAKQQLEAWRREYEAWRWEYNEERPHSRVPLYGLFGGQVWLNQSLGALAALRQCRA